jgi:hypothetical protein
MKQIIMKKISYLLLKGLFHSYKMDREAFGFVFSKKYNQ